MILVFVCIISLIFYVCFSLFCIFLFSTLLPGHYTLIVKEVHCKYIYCKTIVKRFIHVTDTALVWDYTFMLALLKSKMNIFLLLKPNDEK